MATKWRPVFSSTADASSGSKSSVSSHASIPMMMAGRSTGAVRMPARGTRPLYPSARSRTLSRR